MISNTDVQALRKDEENWVRTIIGLNATKTCLAGFAEDVMLKLREHARNEVVKRNRLCKFVSCSQCSIADLLPCPTYDVCFNKSGACKFHVNTPKVCPNSVCNVILEYIIKSHRHHSPSWRNTEPSLWFTNIWEIAKCFLPPDGYNDVKSAEETDFDGIACVIKNCLMFENVTGQNMARSNSSLSKALAVSRGIISSTSLHVTDEQMTSDLHILESLLTDTKCLKERKATKTALQTIKKIRTNDMKITSEKLEEVKLSSYNQHLVWKKKEISYGYADKTGPLQKKQKISNSRQLRSAHSSHGYCSAPETIIIDKDIHKWFSVYIHACADVREINITTDSILCALGITHIAEVNRTFVSSSVVVRLIFMIDHTTMDLMEIFRSIRKKVDGGCKPLSLREENNFSTIYIGSRQNIQMEEIKPCTNAGLLFYGLQEEFVQNCNDLVFDVTNTKDTNAFLEKLDDILERITIKTLRKKTEALVLLKSQIYDNADNKPFYELIESELTKLGFCISRNMNNGEICDAQASTSGTVYKLRSTEKNFFQNVVSRKSEIDQQLCCLKALYARSGVPEDEKPTFPQGNISWNIEKVKSALKGISNIQGFGQSLGKLNVYINGVNTTQKEKSSTLVGKELQKVGLDVADYKMHFIKSENNFCHSVGDKIYTEPKSGTLGAFALRSNVCEERKLCALLSLHVAKHQVEHLAEREEIPLETRRGRVGYILRPLLFSDPSRKYLDIASAKIDDAHIKLCDTQLKDEHGDIKLCTLFDFERDDLQFLDGMPVHIWGASSSPGLGRIKESNFHMENGLHILLENREASSEQFCKEGDSGSVVCAFHRRKRSLIALGMVIGEFNTCQQPTGKRYLALQLKEGLHQLSELQNATYQLCT